MCCISLYQTKCVRYALRADELRAAEETVLLFLRDGDGLAALSSLQVNWYENACAELHLRAKSYGKALKQLLSVDKHFSDMLEDQFDFHQYCFRKGTIRAYVEAIRWGNQLRAHRFHTRAALNLVRLYLRLYDAPREEAQHFEAMASASNLSEAERKEEAKKLKKAAAKTKAAEEKQAAADAAAKAAAQPKGQKKAAEDPDPDGAKLLETANANPLGEATRFMQHLAAQHSVALATHTLGVSLYVRKQRFLLALKHVSRALKLDASHPDTHVALSEFLLAVRAPGVIEALHPAVQAALQAAISSPAFGAGAAVPQLNDAFLTANSTSLPARVAVARVWLLLDPVANLPRAQSIVAQPVTAAERLTRLQATDALTFLTEQLRAPAEAVQTFKQAALVRFPYAVAFGAQPCPPAALDAPARD
jgi:flagellar motor protein MotB